MKRLQFKSKVKPLAMGALATTLCVSLTMSGILSVSNKAFAEEESSATSTSSATKYYTDFSSYEEEQEAGKALNEEIADEGDVLLKNKDNMLPFASSVKKLSVFGVRSVNLQSGGSGSGASTSDGASTLEDSLVSAGYEVNGKLQDYYKGLADQSYEVGTSGLKSVEGSYQLYHDAALIVVSRSGSEFVDNATNYRATDEATGEYVKDAQGNYVLSEDGEKYGYGIDDHYLRFTKYEKELVKYVKDQGFKKIVLVVNSPSAMELADYEDDDAIGGIIWVGLTGISGIMSLGKILNGEVNPSGKTVDVYASDFTKDPTWQNFGDNSQVGGLTTVLKSDGSSFYTGIETVHSIEYEEGIYYGYRWYETAAAENVLKETAIGYDSDQDTSSNSDAYYNRSTGVVYPFGYGLSYTDFTWTIKSATDLGNLTASGEYTITVEVKNTGKVAGKDIVELYSSPKYNEGGIEKAAVTLLDYQKTKLLQPDETQELTFKFKAQDLASFDYNDANGNGFQGYELEAGQGVLSLRTDSHTKKAGTSDIVYNVAAGSVEEGDKNVKAGNTTIKGVEDQNTTGLYFKTDSTTGNTINAIFSQGDVYDTTGNKVTIDGNTVSVKKDESSITYMSRSSFTTTFPTTPTTADVTFSDAVVSYITSQERTYSYQDSSSDPWYKASSDIPSTWTQAADTTGRVDGKTATQLIAMQGVPLYQTNSDGSYKTDAKGNKLITAEWEEFMNQLTYDELVSLVSNGSRITTGLDSIGKPQATDDDGPAQIGAMMNTKKGVSWVSEVNIASTWNVELAERQGIFVGNDSLYIGVNGWYGPAMDIHRNPLAGRNFEYYSSDGIQGGKIAAAVVKGAISKGVHVYIKHLAMNDQETNRYDVCTFATEQAMREIYFKAFELAIKEGGANGTMSAFNRIGINTAASYAVYQELLRDEWNYVGADVTDMYGVDGTTFYPSASGNTLVRSGIYPLGSYQSNGRKLDGTWDASQKCVVVKKPASDTEAAASYDTWTGTELSYTQWYYVRTTAMNLLYTSVNSNLMLNGIDTTTFATKTFESEASSSISNTTVAPTAEALGSDLVVYELTSGSLPDGLTLSSDGTISGTPTKVGTYRFTVQLTADGWVTASQNFVYNVTECTKFSLKGSLTATEGTAYTATISSDKIATTDNFGDYSSITYSISDGVLPEGLTFDATANKISGTPTKAGTYTFTIKATCAKQSNQGSNGSDMGDPGAGGGGGGGDMGGGGGMPGGMMGGSSNDEFERTFTITVSGNAVTTPVTTVDPANGIEFRVNNGNLEWKYKDADSNSWATAVAISELATTSADSSSSSSSSGCGSTLADTSIAIVMGVLALGGVAIAIKASKRKDSDK